MALLDNELARREGGRVEVRTEPLRLRWVIDDLVSSDGHRMRCTVACIGVAIDKGSERQLLSETLLGDRSTARIDHVVAHFEPAIRAAAAREISARPAEQWLLDGTQRELATPLLSAGKRVAFSCGMDLLAPVDIELQSPTLEQQRVEQMQRTLVEQRMAGQVQQLQKASDLIAQFETMRKTAPGLSPSDILKSISPADQGPMLQMLLLGAGGQKTATIAWAVAGTSILKIPLRGGEDSVGPAEQPVLIGLPANLGPLRSIRCVTCEQGRLLLVGARGGVFILDADNLADVRAFADATLASQHGFGSAVFLGGRLWAAHSEGGIVSWNIERPEEPELRVRPANLPGDRSTPPGFGSSGGSSTGPGQSGARNLTVLDEGRLIFSTGSTLVTIDREGTFGAIAGANTAGIVAILPFDQRVVIVREDGLVSVHDRKTLEQISQQTSVGRTSAAALLPWLGSARLLLATDDGPLFCCGIEDALVSQFQSPYRGLRVLRASAGAIVAVSADRQRLVIYRPWDTQRPAGDVNAIAIARHRLADIDLQ